MKWEGESWVETRGTRAPRAWGRSGGGATFRSLGRKGGWRWEQAGLRDRSVGGGGGGGARAGVGAETEDLAGRSGPGLGAAGNTEGAQSRGTGKWAGVWTRDWGLQVPDWGWGTWSWRGWKRRSQVGRG